MRQPSVSRTHTWLCRPRMVLPSTCRSNSSVMLPKSRPNVTMSSLFMMRARFTAGRPLRKAEISSNPCRFSAAPKRRTCSEFQNIEMRVSASLSISACSYFGYNSASSATTSGSLISILKELPFRQHFFWHRRAHSEHGLVDYLAQAELHGNAAQQVSMHRGKAPVLNEQIDHARGCRACGSDCVFRRFDDNPGICCAVGTFCVARLDDGRGQGPMFMEVEA